MKMFSIPTMGQAAAALALSTALIATPAMAGEKGQQISVEWRDLNLGSVEGQRTLDQRIARAAEQVCGVAETRTGTRLSSRAADRCVKKAKASTKRQIAAIRDNTELGG